jgi:hypothetical protein
MADLRTRYLGMELRSPLGRLPSSVTVYQAGCRHGSWHRQGLQEVVRTWIPIRSGSNVRRLASCEWSMVR